MFKKLFVVLMLIPIIAFAQSSGKIAGVVNDKSTGEPLPGVNVILEGTTMGSASDIDGYFVILNVPVTVYSIRANYIGYKDVVVENLRVSAGITTELNFQLEPTTLELEEAIVITAERPLVDKNVTSSISLVTSKEIENVPVRGLQNLIALQTSVVVQDNNVHIRGSRRDEVGYYVNGAASNSVLDNSQAVYVIQEAIEEFQVFAGGYAAEMGGANGGIIRSELKTGGSDYHVSVDYQTDRLATEGQKFLETYSYGYQNIVGTLSGPLLSNKVRFFLAGENMALMDRQKRFSKGYEFPNLHDDGSVTGTEATETIYYPEGFTPHNQQIRTSVNGTVLFDFSKFKIRIGGAYNYQKDQLDPVPMLNILNDRGFFQLFNSLLLTGRLTHVLSPTTYYDLNVSYYDRKREREDEVFGNNWEAWFDSTANAAEGIEFASRWSPGDPYIFNGFRFMRPGSPSVAGHRPPFYLLYPYQVENQNYLGGALNFVSQIGRHHEVKAGLDARYYTVRYFSISPYYAFQTAETYGGMNAMKASDSLATVWATAGGVDNYGYNFFGETYDGEGINAPKHPLFGSLYLQDKIEFNDLIINAGLRLDYFDSDDRALIDPEDPAFDVNTSQVLDEAFKTVDPYVQLSPRLGVSFPVTERTVFYFQYGKFLQMSELNNIYFGSNRLSRQLIGGFYYINPIGCGLEPIKTTSYEVGFRQQLSSVAAFEINGFYKNVKGQVQVYKQTVASGAFVSAYERFVNQDFATTKGIEFRVNLRRTNRLQAQLNYTLTSAEGTGSTEVSYHGAVYNSDQQPTILSPLDFSQTHTGALILDYRFAKNDGGPILQQLGTNLIFSFTSGHPFTYVTYVLGQVSLYDAGTDYMNDTRSRYATEPVGTSRTPWNFNFDLRLDKTFSLVNIDMTLYFVVQNVLNTKNVINVFQASGSAQDDAFLSDPTKSESFINSASGNDPEQVELTKSIYRAINLENGQAYWDALGNQLYDTPRQIWLGIKIAY